MIIKPPSTLQEFLEIRATILSLMANPFLHESTLPSLEIKLQRTNQKIGELSEK